MTLNLRPVLVLVLALFAGACTDTLVEPVTELDVSASMVEGNISEASQLQDALDAAAASGAPARIRLAPRSYVGLHETLVYDGAAPIVIDGRGSKLVGPEEGSAIAFTGGADVTLRNLSVKGAAEHGVYVEVPGDRSGMLSVSLRDVQLLDNGFAGMWIDDQVHDSPASVSLRVVRSYVSGNNIAGLDEVGLTWDEILAFADKDGIRVNEGGMGDLHLFIQGSNFYGNQADGIELDETGPGDVHSLVLNSHFDQNGDQLIFPDEVPAGFPDDPSDYEKDLEDGFDIDENDAGSIYAAFRNVTAKDNEDEGIDLDETYDGSITMTGSRITANDNFGTGIKLTESEDQTGTDGDIRVNLLGVTAHGSRDSRGFRLEEFQAGDVLGRIVRGSFEGNDSDGFRVEEYEEGAIDLRIVRTTFRENGDDGLQAEENGKITLVSPVFAGNAGDDIAADDAVEVIVRGKR